MEFHSPQFSETPRHWSAVSQARRVWLFLGLRFYQFYQSQDPKPNTESEPKSLQIGQRTSWRDLLGMGPRNPNSVLLGRDREKEDEVCRIGILAAPLAAAVLSQKLLGGLPWM